MVAELMMIFITVAGFGLMVGVTNQWLSLQRADKMEVIRERLVIEDAWFRPAPDDSIIRLYVTNTGKIDVEMQFINVLGIRRWPETEGETVDVERGACISIDINLGSAWTPDKRYDITLITGRGNQFEASFWSPT